MLGSALIAKRDICPLCLNRQNRRRRLSPVLAMAVNCFAHYRHAGSNHFYKLPSAAIAPIVHLGLQSSAVSSSCSTISFSHCVVAIVRHQSELDAFD